MEEEEGLVESVTLEDLDPAIMGPMNAAEVDPELEGQTKLTTADPAAEDAEESVEIDPNSQTEELTDLPDPSSQGQEEGSSEFNPDSDGLVEIDPPESIEAANNGTQTPVRESLSFEDPRLFELDLGPDKDALRRISRLSRGKKSQSQGQEEYELQEEAQSDYQKRNLEIPGEVEEEEEEEEELPKPRTSLEEFDELYMNFSDSCVNRRQSEDILTIPTRRSTPSPPGTPEVSAKVNRCPSIESFFKLSEKITIHFHILPGKKVYSKDIRLDQTVINIKEELSKIVKVPAKYLELRRNKNLVMDYKTLKDIGGLPGKKLRFSVEVSHRVQGQWAIQVPEYDKLPARDEVVRKVRVPTGFGWKTVTVNIELPDSRKLFIGGYRHKETAVEYHHAVTQTQIVHRELRENQSSKTTQSFHETNNCMNTLVTTYTQVDRCDYYASCRKQRLVRAQRYVTAAQWEKKREKAAITVQKYWRRWLAMKEKDERMLGLIKRVEWAEHIRKGRMELRLAIKDDELFRQYNPRSLLDLELLYRAINVWRKQEVDYVLMNRWGAEKKAALADIMEKETDLLLDLERAKRKIINSKNKHLVDDLFDQMGKPTRWLSRTGHFVTVDNPGKGQSRIFQDLYTELSKPVVDVNERLELLNKLYKMVKDHRKVTTSYLIQLIGREIALMERKARVTVLSGIRKRILNGFFALCKDTDFNPEARKLQKVPFETPKLRKDMVQCKGCRKMLYRDQFTISRGVTVTNSCLTCMGLYRTCILRVDMNLYRRMLQELRQDEQQQGVGSSIAYVIDEFDLQFLIEQIWHGQSALSGIDDRYLLRLCRWIRTSPWSPWNCVLLTEAEAVAHLHITDMTVAYQQSFFEKVRLRHNSARSYFQRTGKIALALDPGLQSVCLDREEQKRNETKKQFAAVKSKSVLKL